MILRHVQVLRLSAALQTSHAEKFISLICVTKFNHSISLQTETYYSTVHLKYLELLRLLTKEP